MTDVTWTQIADNRWRTDSQENGLYGHVIRVKGDDGVDEFWAHTYLDADDIPAGPGETGEVWTDLEDAKNAAETYLGQDWPNNLSF
jgi:hypothetical protein